MERPNEEEIKKKISMVRLLYGDSPSSPFYPLFEDEEIEQFLELTNWNVQQAAKKAAIAASLNFSQVVYRERTGDIEVWNNVSIQYLKALENLINEDPMSRWGAMKPYFGGIKWDVKQEINCNPNNVISPLVKASKECTTTALPDNVLLLEVTDKDGINGYFTRKACC